MDIFFIAFLRIIYWGFAIAGFVIRGNTELESTFVKEKLENMLIFHSILKPKSHIVNIYIVMFSPYVKANKYTASV